MSRLIIDGFGEAYHPIPLFGGGMEPPHVLLAQHTNPSLEASSVSGLDPFAVVPCAAVGGFDIHSPL